MFWGAFSYDKKGPCHIWRPETAQEKKTAEKELAEMNTAREPEFRQKWELVSGMRRLGLCNKPGKAPVWKFTWQNGKLVRSAKAGGIDWYRYG